MTAFLSRLKRMGNMKRKFQISFKGNNLMEIMNEVKAEKQ